MNVPARRRIDVAAMIAVPVIVNLVLAAALFSSLPRVIPPPSGSADPVPIGPAASHSGLLPQASFDTILARVEAETGHRYSCDGPWSAGRAAIKWACRTPDAVVVLEAVDPRSVFLIYATGFGLDPGSSDLPAWASAAQETVELRETVRSWVMDNVGTRTETVVGGVRLKLGGARGAAVLEVST